MPDGIHSNLWMQHSQYVLLGLLFICRKRSQTRKPLWAQRKCSSTSKKKEAMPISAGRPESMPSWDGTQWLAFQAGVKFSSSAVHLRRESLVYSCYLPSVHYKKTSFPDHTKCHKILSKPILKHNNPNKLIKKTQKSEMWTFWPWSVKMEACHMQRSTHGLSSSWFMFTHCSFTCQAVTLCLCARTLWARIPLIEGAFD